MADTRGHGGWHGLGSPRHAAQYGEIELGAERALCLTWKTPLQVRVVEFPRELAACSPEGIRTPDLFLERYRRLSAVLGATTLAHRAVLGKRRGLD
jgi:hypothetical protein